MSTEQLNPRLVSGLGQRMRASAALWRWGLTTAERKFILVFVDLLLINAALLIAVTLWNGFTPSVTTLVAHGKWFITLSIVWLGFGIVLDIYNLARSASTTNILASAGAASLLTMGLYLLIPWLTPPILARGFVFGFVILSTALILAWRAFYAQALNQPTFRQWALILGTGHTAQLLRQALNQGGHERDANPFRGTGYQVVGLLSDEMLRAPRTDGDSSIVASEPASIAFPLPHQRVDEVIVALDDQGVIHPQVYTFLLNCRESGRRVTTAAEVYERLTGRLPVNYDSRDWSLLLGPKDAASHRLYAAIKLLLDYLIAMGGLLALAVIVPVVALGNALTSRGPLFYRQERVGKGGQTFQVIKFRTMVPDAERATGAVWSSENDPRITPMGRWLRKIRLDEVPQVINVLRGEMSIVGPRPERPHFVETLSQDIPLYRARHAVKPGITGWAQVHYRYGNTVEDSRVKLEFDLYYVKHASPYLDLLVMLQTLRVVLQMKGM